MTKIIHNRIAKTAKALAAAAYEEMAKENEFYRLHPSMRNYVRRSWQHYIVFARQALVEILRKDYAYEIALGAYTPASVEAMKNEAYECLLIDGEFKETSPSSLYH